MRRLPRSYFSDNLTLLRQVTDPLWAGPDAVDRIHGLYRRALLDCMSAIPAKKFAAILKACSERDDADQKKKSAVVATPPAVAASLAGDAKQGEVPAEPLRAEVTLTVQGSSSAGAIEKLAPTSIPTPDDECEECGHKISRHGKDGCEVELGDGYRNGLLQALGPCSCTAVTCEPAEIEGAA